MLVLGFPAGALQANCYLVALGEGRRCVVVDPGQDAMESLDQQVREHDLVPEAVLLTHGHFDHVFSAVDVCGRYGVPAWIHPADRFMLADPAAALGPQGRDLFGADFSLNEPDDVRELAGGAVLDLAGLRFEVRHSPGHTAGSVLFHTAADQGGQLVLAGDTLFAGGIGRTDLPGGDPRDMERSLRDQILSLPDETVVLAGHGPTTTIGSERANNPYLQDLPAPVARDAGTA